YEQRAGRNGGEPLLQEVLEGGKAERPDPRPDECLGRHKLLHCQPYGLRKSSRDEEADALTSQSTKNELQCRGGRRVEPLDVVDGEKNRSFRSKLGKE